LDGERLAGPIVEPDAGNTRFMSPLGWTLTAVVTFSAGWLLIPLIAAWASHKGRLDPALEQIGRPFGRVADWVEHHPRTIRVIVALLGILYAAAVWTTFRDEQHFMGVLVTFNGSWLCLSLLSMHRMLRTSTHARHRSPRQAPRHREEERGR
jgi:hypothetical protein